MALIDPNARVRYDIPHEPGQWVELKPINAGELADAQRRGKDQPIAEVVSLILEFCLKDWSYDVPITAETIRQLDYETHTWLQTQVDLTSGQKSDAEKKDSNENSSTTPTPEMDGSLVSSAT